MINNLERLNHYLDIADQALKEEASYSGLTSSDLRRRIEKTIEIHRELKVDLDLPKSLACLRALCGLLSKQGLADCPHRLQLAAAAALYDGTVIEMANGEGKTLAGTLAAALRAKTGMKVHISTFNEYLVRRDATWMWPIYDSLGLTVSCLELGTDYGFLANGPAINDLEMITAKKAYEASVLYAEKSRLGFDFLSDNILHSSSDRKQGPLEFVLIDEIDSILIDEAREDLLISSTLDFPVSDISREAAYRQAWEVSQQLHLNQHYTAEVENWHIDLTDEGRRLAQTQIGADLYNDPSILWAELLTNCLKAREICKRGKHYQVIDNSLYLIDILTGRIKRQNYSTGLHQALLMKEGLAYEPEAGPCAKISVQNFYKQYQVISGMSGSILSEAQEIEAIYQTSVIQIPTQSPIIRQDEKFIVYNTIEERDLAAVQDALEKVEQKRPVLIGVENEIVADEIEKKLKNIGVLPVVLTATKNQAEAEKIALAGKPGTILVTAKLAGRGTDIKLDSESIAAGGLHVIVLGTQDIRYENQLRGRAGRRGLPGTSVCIISLFDEIMRAFGGSRISKIMRRLGMEWGVPIDSNLVSRRIDAARWQLKLHSFHLRSSLYTADSVLDSFRKFIYTVRGNILEEATDPQSVLVIFADNHVHRLFDKQRQESGQRMSLDAVTAAVVTNLCNTLEDVTVHTFRQSVQTKTFQERAEGMAFSLIQEIENRDTQIRQLYSDGDQVITPDPANLLIQSCLLKAIDSGWKDFLETYDQVFEMARVKGVTVSQMGGWVSEQSYGYFQKLLSDIEFTALHQWMKSSGNDRAIREALLLQLQTRESWEAYLTLLERFKSISEDEIASLHLAGGRICRAILQDNNRALQWYDRALDATLRVSDRHHQWMVAAEFFQLAAELSSVDKFREIRGKVIKVDPDFEVLANMLVELMAVIVDPNVLELRLDESAEIQIQVDYLSLPREGQVRQVVDSLFSRAINGLSEIGARHSIASLIERWQQALAYWLGRWQVNYIVDDAFQNHPPSEPLTISWRASVKELIALLKGDNPQEVKETDTSNE
jgi:preprotein translocase subunit SecA